MVIRILLNQFKISNNVPTMVPNLFQRHRSFFRQLVPVLNDTTFFCSPRWSIRCFMQWHRNKRYLFSLSTCALDNQKIRFENDQLPKKYLTVPRYDRCYCTKVAEEPDVVCDDVIQKYLHQLKTQYERSSSSPQLSSPSNSLVDLEHIVSLFSAHQQLHEDVNSLGKIIRENDNDVDLIKMANDEIYQRRQEMRQLESDICDLLVPDSTDDSSDVILEVTAGVGGQEAMLFTREMLNMYVNYAQYKGWASSLISQEDVDLGGVRHATVNISGRDAYKALKFEGGVHRIQRVPKTERSGRVHTSTMTVAVLPQPAEIDVYVNPKDLRIETCRASGKGGQHVNTTDSAVRIVHIPTGTFAECQTERSQLKNKDSAMKMLCSRLYQKEQEKSNKQFSTSRKLQVGSASRNEKVRTYNVKDDRITDHRIRVSLNDVKGFLEGGASLDELMNTLRVESRKERLVEVLASLTKT